VLNIPTYDAYIYEQSSVGQFYVCGWTGLSVMYVCSDLSMLYIFNNAQCWLLAFESFSGGKINIGTYLCRVGTSF
jgi:hypothetical protein